jgi:diguanylate cyclase (GGDEF)-like protein
MAARGAEEKLKRLKATVRVLRSMSANLELEEISRISVRELVDIVGCDVCAITLIEGNKVRVLAEKGFSKIFAEIKLTADMPAIKEIVKTKQAILARDVLSSPASSWVPQGSPMNSLICTPIIVDEDVRGIILFYSLKKNAFDEEDMELTEMLAKEISMALQSSFQYAQGRDMSIRDKVTRCLNYEEFQLDIVAEIASAKEDGKQLSLLIVDIDSFKKYNYVHGQPKADKLLEKIADILTYSIRPYDKPYRYGGGKFAILMPDTDKEKASSAARRLQNTIHQAQFEGEKESQPDGTITVSIGVATFPSDADHSDKLIETAESALSRAKESGGNQVYIS